MKTTLEIPNEVFRRAKARAAELKIPLRKLVSDAVAEKLATRPADRQRARKALVGRLRHLRAETERINARIEEAFETIEPEDRL
jgi:hypothetical protein